MSAIIVVFIVLFILFITKDSWYCSAFPDECEDAEAAAAALAEAEAEAERLRLAASGSEADGGLVGGLVDGLVSGGQAVGGAIAGAVSGVGATLGGVAAVFMGNGEQENSPEKCEEYARGGECESTPDWMKTHCPGACEKLEQPSSHTECWNSIYGFNDNYMTVGRIKQYLDSTSQCRGSTEETIKSIVEAQNNGKTQSQWENGEVAVEEDEVGEDEIDEAAVTEETAPLLCEEKCWKDCNKKSKNWKKEKCKKDRCSWESCRGCSWC